MKNRIVWLGVVLLITTSTLVAQDTVRICTYNLLKISSSNEAGRTQQYARILDSVRPHILVTQEVLDATVGPRFVSEVLTWAPFAATAFIDGPDSDNQVYYDQEKFDLVSTRVIPTELRNILEVVLSLRPTGSTLADTIVVYSVHLKAQDNSEDAAQRAREVNAMITNMTQRERIIVCGDFNIYSPNEQAYTLLVGPTASRQFVDPLGTNWRRNVATFAGMYSQCTRATNISGCGGGVDGGLDDRFDLILASAALAPRVLNSTYTAFGNDGQARLNQSIDDPPNTRVSAELAAALKCASDHLPVVVDVLLGDVQAGIDATPSESLRVTFLDDRLTVVGPATMNEVRIVNARGMEVARLKCNLGTAVMSTVELASGVYTVSTTSSQARFVITR